ncbi:MAG: putative acyl-CoA reductase, partial [Myxococcaceae bacterium]|nr:putative acyl-CoA reductase [Myxococcaceae bacterium]
VVLAASVATAPLRALALPLLRGAASVALKPSRHQPRFAALLGDPVAADDTPFDHLIAYGADDTLAALRASLPPGVTFEGHGHGFALSIVRTTNHRAAAARVAEDVAWYDQRGCLSPQAVLVTAGDPGAFAEQLHRALAELAPRLPRGPLDVGLGAAVMQWQGVQAATARRFWRGDDHAVALHDAPAIGSPGARHVTVAGLDEPGLHALVTHHAPWLTALGVDGPTRDLATIAGFHGRVVPAGELQDPPLDGPEDPRPPLAA